MEDRQLPITIGQGAGARVVTLDLPPFTLVGATTRTGLLTTPLRDRFGIQHRLDYYAPDELARDRRTARPASSTCAIDADGALAIAGAQPRHPARRQPAAASACATTRRCAATGVIDGRRRGRGARPSRGRPRGPRPPGPRDPRRRVCDDASRAARRALHARDRRGRGARHARGRLRAVPAAARAAPAHPAGRAATVRAYEHLGLEPPRGVRAVLTPVPPERRRIRAARPLPFRRGVSWPIYFICPNCGNRSAATDRTAGFRSAPKGCSKCGFGFLIELLDDYYPAPDAAFFVCDQQGRVIGCGRGSFELTGLDDERVIGRPVREVLGLVFEDEEDHVETVLEWGVRKLAKPVDGQRGGRPARPRDRRSVPRL